MAQENRGLLFIPDISGFTRFVTNIEIEHSRSIIQELLETIMNANTMGLTVSEVEGDAILFYKFGDTPDLKDIYQQVERMFCAFHAQLGVYDIRKYCQCNACVSAVDLTLKVITHYGEFTGYTVKDFNKLIGKDVIVAHQLLKNDIDQHEYWLVTDNLLKDSRPADYKTWMKWDHSIKKTEEGEIPFHYTQLSNLKNELPLEKPLSLEMRNKILVCSATKEVDAHIFHAFHATGDFNFRHLWKDGVKKVEEAGHLLPRVGMKCRYILDNEEVVIYASSYSFHPEHIEFSETDEKKQSSYYYTLEALGPELTRITISYYVQPSFINKFLGYGAIKKRIQPSIERSLDRLVKVVLDLKEEEKDIYKVADQA